MSDLKDKRNIWFTGSLKIGCMVPDDPRNDSVNDPVNGN